MPLSNNIPEWIKWLAQDADGAWWGYSVEPLQFSHGWYENEVGDKIKIQQDEANPNWENSLTKVKHSR